MTVKKKPESPGIASKASPRDTGPATSSSSQGGRAFKEYDLDADTATGSRTEPKPRSHFSEPAESSKREKHFNDLSYDGKPPKILRTPVFLTFAEAVDELAGKSKSEAVREKARRDIRRALREGKLRLGGYGVRSMVLGKKRQQQVRLKAKARKRAMLIWNEDRGKTVSDVAKSIGSQPEFSGVAERTLKAWVNNLKPK